MHIEQLMTELVNALAANTSAQEANTDALTKILAKSGEAPANVTPITKTEAVPKGKAKAEPAKEPEPTPEPEPEPTPAAANDDDIDGPGDTTGKTPDELRAEITAYVKGVFAAAGGKLGEKKTTYEAIRDKYGVKKVTELDDDKLAEFLAKVQAGLR